MLAKHSGQDEVVVGIPYANREHPATHEVVGYFVNTLAIRVGLDGIASFRDVVVETGKSVSKVVEHVVLSLLYHVPYKCLGFLLQNLEQQ